MEQIKYSRECLSECVRVWPGVFLLQEARSQQGARLSSPRSTFPRLCAQKEEGVWLEQDLRGCGYQGDAGCGSGGGRDRGAAHT